MTYKHNIPWDKFKTGEGVTKEIKWFVLCERSVVENRSEPTFSVFPLRVCCFIRTIPTSDQRLDSIWYNGIITTNGNTIMLDINNYDVKLSCHCGTTINEMSCLEFSSDGIATGYTFMFHEVLKRDSEIDMHKLCKCISLKDYQYGRQMIDLILLDSASSGTSQAIDPLSSCLLVESYCYFYSTVYGKSPNLYRDHLYVKTTDLNTEECKIENYRSLMDRYEFYDNYVIFSSYTDNNIFGVYEPVIVRRNKIHQTMYHPIPLES